MAKTMQNREQGIALMIAMILLLLITALAFGVIVMSNTENSINTNFKASETEYFAARAGVEEGRNRLLPNMTDQNGTPITLVAPFLPSAPPDQGGTILYILNGVTLAQVMTPSTTASPNPYFDDQL